MLTTLAGGGVGEASERAVGTEPESLSSPRLKRRVGELTGPHRARSR